MGRWKMKWILKYHLSKFYFLFNEVQKRNANSSQKILDKSSRKTMHYGRKTHLGSTWGKFTDQLKKNNNNMITAALNI